MPRFAVRFTRAARSPGLAVLASATVLLTLLGHKPLTDWDEGIYAEVSREMLRGGWLAPHWNGQLWLEKPPLMLWITAALFRLFGVTEFWARAGSALSGVAAVTISHAWLLRRRGMQAAWLSTLMLLGTFGFLHTARVGEMDVLLSLGCLISIIGIAQVVESKASGWLLFWAGFAVAAMTKGAASIVIPLSALVCWALEPRALPRFGRVFFAGGALFAIAVAPWHVAMFHRFDGRFVAEYLGLHVWSRATAQIEGHATHWWYYCKVLLVSAPPFCLLYAVAVFRSMRDRTLRPFGVFALVAFVFFTTVQTRLPHYIAPVYPALSLVTAAWAADWISARRAEHRRREFWLGAGAVAVIVVGASIALTASGRRSLHSATLANGTVLAGNKDATAVLRRAAPLLRDIPGPLLVWRERDPPIIADVFYSRRLVQQVLLASAGNGAERDRYLFDPFSLDDVVNAKPALLLADTSLLPTLPRSFRFTPIDRSGEVALGWIVRTER